MNRRRLLLLALAGAATLIVWILPRSGDAIRRDPPVEAKPITLRVHGVPSDWEVYVNEEHGFLIHHPPGWTTTAPGPAVPGGRVVSLPGLAPKGEEITFFVDIRIRLVAASDQDDIESWFEKNNTTVDEDREVISRLFDLPPETISIEVAPFDTGAGRAVRKSFRIDAPGGPSIFALDKVEYLFLRGRDVLTITGFTPSGPQAAGALESIDRAVATFSVLRR